MIANTPSNHPTRRLSVIALLAAAFGSMIGCKSNQPASPPIATTPAQRQPVTPVPAVKKHLYSAEADPKTDIAAALKQASLEHKRVILDFGGDWCGDCQVLDIYLHQNPNVDIFEKNFLLVHVDIGRFDKNLDIAEKYDIPLKKGVPALAVLDSHGKLLFSQENKEFENMRNMKSEDVTAFLNKWKA